MSHRAPKTRSAPRRSSRKSCTRATFGGGDPVLPAMRPSLTAWPRRLPKTSACDEVDALTPVVDVLESLERVGPVAVEAADLEAGAFHQGSPHVARAGPVVVGR